MGWSTSVVYLKKNKNDPCNWKNERHTLTWEEFNIEKIEIGEWNKRCLLQTIRFILGEDKDWYFLEDGWNCMELTYDDLVKLNEKESVDTFVSLYKEKYWGAFDNLTELQIEYMTDELLYAREEFETSMESALKLFIQNCHWSHVYIVEG